MFFATTLNGQSVFINEINWVGSNLTDGVEVAGPAGQDLAGWQIVIYNFLGLVSETKALNGVIPDQDNGYGAIWYDVEQGFVGNGVALINPSNDVVQFLSYGLTSIVGGVGLILTPDEGPAAGATSILIGVVQVLSTNSMQLIGTGTTYTDFVWDIPLGITESAVNTSQFFVSLLILPVELTNFEAKKVGEEVAITWTTASEVNVDYFELERSSDGQNFKPIYQTESLGTHDGERTYHFIDKSPEGPVSYYRLKNIDLDGSSGTSEIVAVNFRKTGVKQLYLVPGTQKLMINYYEDNTSQEGQLWLFDVNGQMLGQYQVNSGFKTQEIDLTPIIPGAYFIKISLDGQVYTRLIISN